jgi:hypothetical protein
VRDSDGTLILYRGFLSGGTALTRRLAKIYGRPLFELDLERPWNLGEIADWIMRERIEVLNVAGPRGGSNPEIQGQSYRLIGCLLQRLADLRP